jgi:hypothetical protein
MEVTVDVKNALYSPIAKKQQQIAQSCVLMNPSEVPLLAVAHANKNGIAPSSAQMALPLWLRSDPG